MQELKQQLEAIEALEYHRKGKAGKIAIIPTKPLFTQHDLSLAYSPGVAIPCLEIFKDPEKIYEYTSRGNMVAVISNGSAVLGLGNLGAGAAKPVMEGKAVLFKKFADIDAIDIEVDTQDAEEFINIVKHLGYSWGGINLEDIKAPECFIIEEKLKACMQIPVFHDDQHGTAIIAAAGLINAAYLTNRSFAEIKIVINGAGAAALACIELLIELGIKQENVILCDTKGVIYKGRKDGINKWKEVYAATTELRTLAEAMQGADVFLGLSVKDSVTKDMIASMASNPIIFALANPDPEILPEDIMAVRKDAIIATGRSDYYNQINNVMGFPYIFRGALDVRATTINKEMKIAASHAIANLARESVPEEVYKAYPNRKMNFGADYIIPVPFDPRLITTVPLAVAKAAIDSNVARVVHLDAKKYKAELASRLNPTSQYMDALFEIIQGNPQRIVFAEGEEEEVIKAAILMRDNGFGYPILVGRAPKIRHILDRIGYSIDLQGIEIVNAQEHPKHDKYTDCLYEKLQRRGYLRRDCERLVKLDANVFAACMVASNDADAILTGVSKSYFNSLEDISKVINPKANQRILSYSIMIVKEHNIIIADNSISELPTSQELVEIAVQTARIAKSMGYHPKIAFLSFSNFGNPIRKHSERVRQAVQILDNLKVDFEYDGEMTADVALNPVLRKAYPFCRLSGPANILIMPGLHSASISTHLLQELAGGSFIGPIVDGFEYPVQIAQMGASANDIIKIAAFAAIQALNIDLRQ